MFTSSNGHKPGISAIAPDSTGSSPRDPQRDDPPASDKPASPTAE
jgi:hypothetical protein